MTTGERKGARTIAAIPPAVLRDLNAGRIETKTLVEWLAIDMAKLLRAVLPAEKELIARAKARAGEGITKRVRTTGADLHELLGTRAAKLATHSSDMVRAFAAYAAAADPAAKLPERLRRAHPFAADPSMAVRECAWDSIRPFLAEDLPLGISLLQPWVRDRDANIRRCAIEGTRPRGVWCKHIEALKSDPEPARPLLEVVRADPSRYVLTSAANWINDASKSRPDWARALCARWTRESPAKETAWLVNHALRTLRKKSTPL